MKPILQKTPPHISIEIRALDNLAPYKTGLRKNASAVQRMVDSIQAYGFKIPLLVSEDGSLIDGDLRLKAARKLGYTELPVIVCRNWTEEQVRAFRLLVNRSATWAEWDLDAVANEIAELSKTDFDLQLTGFDAAEIEEFLSPLLDEQTLDSAPPAPSVATSVRGDLWMCGNHRVLCGDSTSATDVERLCGTSIPVLMVTDPPYGVGYDPQWREQAGLGVQRQTGIVQNDDRVDWAEAFELFRGDVAYVWHAGLYAAEVAASLKQAGFSIRSQIIWAKQHFALSRGNYHWQHEPCWYAVRQGRPAHWCGDRKQSTLWEVSNLNPFGGSDEFATGHGTQKPVELMCRPILNHTARGEMVYDPFLGSGSTLAAAEGEGRICYGLEIDPLYADVIVLRWQTLTKKAAILEGDRRTFDQIRAERRSAREAEVLLNGAA
ncbi:MAG: DNA modification methylase [Bryobacteraceae bacterium]